MIARLASLAAAALVAAAAVADTEQPTQRVQILLMKPGDAFLCTGASGCVVLSPQLLNVLIERAKASRECGPTI